MKHPKVLLLQTAASPDSWADVGKLGKSSTKDGDSFLGSYSTESKPKQSCFPYDTWIFFFFDKNTLSHESKNFLGHVDNK